MSTCCLQSNSPQRTPKTQDLHWVDLSLGQDHTTGYRELYLPLEVARDVFSWDGIIFRQEVFSECIHLWL